MIRGSGNGFSFFSEADLLEEIQINNAKILLTAILMELDRQVVGQSKSGAIQTVKQLQQAFRACSKLIPSQIYDEFSSVIISLESALTSVDFEARRSQMVKVEKYHAAMPAFILHMPELRLLVFSK